MSWKAVLMENWPYKLTALLLGLLLWVNVAVEERAERGITVTPEWVVADSEFVLVDAPDRLEAIFQGSGSELFEVATGSPRIRYVLEDVSTGTRTLRLSTDSVHYPSSANVRVTGLRPASADLTFERRVRARLPVRPDLRVIPAANFQMAAEPHIEPDSVTVLGARSEVGSLSFLTTEPEELRDVRETRRMDLTVRVPEGLGSVEVRPQIVLVTVRADTVVEERYRRPLSDTSGVLRDGLVPAPDTVTVTVRGPESVVRSLAPAAVRAVLDGGPPAEAGQELPVRVALPDTLLTATSDPITVELRRPGGQ